MEDGTKKTIIEDGTEFDGSIRSKCPIAVSGKLKGELQAPALTVHNSGSVQGQVVVSELHSEGEISGEIEAEVVVLSGKVSDHTVINAKTLEVKLDQPGGLQVKFGNCELNVGQPQRGKKPKHEETKEHDEVLKPVL